MSPVRLTLEPQFERVWQGDNPSPATFNPEHGHFPLYHQWRTYKATEPLIVNTYNTGTGKTKAALLRLLKRTREIGFNYLDSSEHNALLIAPTNELLAQHARDAEKFCEENNLPYRVVSISRAELDNYKAEDDFSEGYLRHGAALHYILQNPRKIKGDSSKKATLFVVNPVIYFTMRSTFFMQKMTAYHCFRTSSRCVTTSLSMNYIITIQSSWPIFSFL